MKTKKHLYCPICGELGKEQEGSHGMILEHTVKKLKSGKDIKHRWSKRSGRSIIPDDIVETIV